jgi:glycosyltransferase involved in cell wall biosynthesis
MHICLITGIFPPDIGGPSTYVSHLAQLLRQNNIDVCVITLGDNSPEFPFFVKRVSRTYPLLVRLIVLFGTLIRYGWQSDVWYINGLELPAVLAGKLLRKRMVMKIVGDYAWERAMNAGLTTDGIDDFQQKRQSWKVELHKRLRTWYTRQVERVITPSRYLKSLVCGWGIAENRVQVIYNAVEKLPEHLGTKLEVRNQLGFSEHDRLLITVGRLVAWKGIDLLIQTVARLDESVQLLIVGDGPEKNKLTDLAETLSVTHRVKFLGKAERHHALAYMRASDLFVLHTGYEGFSHVLLEAMMVGTPVMTTPVCGNPELVIHAENGLLVEQGNLESLRTQITGILHDPALRKRLVEGGIRAVQQYSWERLNRQTMEVLCGY